MRLAKRLKLAGVYETSAKTGDEKDSLLSVDDLFFRAIVNCVDQNPICPNKKKLDNDKAHSSLSRTNL